mmetsp:Transcript_23286/g.56473  ORF Transcript_23286/g.56473 Transcript_23286/m.56473 type:complete len:285 (-) Transcript_23286:307-1161(-)
MAAPPSATLPPCQKGLEAFEVSQRTKLGRKPGRGSHQIEKVYGILDEGLTCTVSYLTPDGELRALPQLFGRDGDWLYLHGSSSAGMFKGLRKEAKGDKKKQELKFHAVVTVALVDGLVLARSLMHHSINYRSVVLFADTAHVLHSDEEKCRGLRAITENTVKGRWNDARQPSKEELTATGVMKIRISECSAKFRTGPPGDDKKDMSLSYWAGVVPIQTVYGEPVPDKECQKKRIPVPDYLLKQNDMISDRNLLDWVRSLIEGPDILVSLLVLIFGVIIGLQISV